MSDFDHGAWARAKTELSLNPLHGAAKELIDRMLAGEAIRFDVLDCFERAAIIGLHKAGVADYYPTGDRYTESKQLRAAHERGLISELFA